MGGAIVRIFVLRYYSNSNGIRERVYEYRSTAPQCRSTRTRRVSCRSGEVVSAESTDQRAADVGEEEMQMQKQTRRSQ